MIEVVAIIFLPISNYPIFMASGLIFGQVSGFFINWAGVVAGTFLILALTKKFGRPLVKKIVAGKTINKYDGYVQKYGPLGLLAAYALPFFPDDELTYLAGLSSLPIKNIVYVIIGRIPAAAFSFIGDDLVNGTIISLAIRFFILAMGAVIYFRKEIIKFFQPMDKLKKF